MLPTKKSLLLLLTLFALFATLAACGGGDDDDSGDDDDDSAADDSGSRTSSNKDVDLPKLADGQFADGTVHVETSGDKDLKLDAPGSGITSGGFTLLTFISSSATILIAFNTGEDDPGSLSVTTVDFVSGGEWGKDCNIDVNDSANELKGTFECKDVDAIDPRSTKSLETTIKGNFSVKR